MRVKAQSVAPNGAHIWQNSEANNEHQFNKLVDPFRLEIELLRRQREEANQRLSELEAKLGQGQERQESTDQKLKDLAEAHAALKKSCDEKLNHDTQVSEVFGQNRSAFNTANGTLNESNPWGASHINSEVLRHEATQCISTQHTPHLPFGPSSSLRGPYGITRIAFDFDGTVTPLRREHMLMTIHGFKARYANHAEWFESMRINEIEDRIAGNQYRTIQEFWHDFVVAVHRPHKQIHTLAFEASQDMAWWVKSEIVKMPPVKIMEFDP